MRRARVATALAAALAVGGLAAPPPAAAVDCTRTSTGSVPLTDMGTGTYHGETGGLYGNGSNARPAAHTALGLQLARLAVPRSAVGLPDSSGRLGFLTIGMSNTRLESAALVTRAAADPLRDPRVTVVNGAHGGQTASIIADPAAPYWSYVDQQVASAGLTAAQVQAVWLKEANARPAAAFPEEARKLESDLRAIVQILKTRFPNLWLVYLSSRIYAGYATTALNPEPHAYESAFAVRWLVRSQVDGTYPVAEPQRGVVAPWLSWGPYLWADGLTPRSDGLTWVCEDFAQDGVHPSATGAGKVAGRLLGFLHNDVTARTWYTQGN